MKEYKYKGQTFQVDAAGGCEMKVSDSKNTITITPNSSGASVYRVSTVKGGWWWHTNTVEESLNRACRELLESGTAISPEEACKALADFVGKLVGAPFGLSCLNLTSRNPALILLGSSLFRHPLTDMLPVKSDAVGVDLEIDGCIQPPPHPHPLHRQPRPLADGPRLAPPPRRRPRRRR